MGLNLGRESTLLFIGDSITDAGRRQDPEGVGHGFVRMVRDYLYAKSPGTAPQVVNRGISGNKIPDLEKRWQRDVLEIRPNVVSVYIGINDVWHGLLPTHTGCAIDAYVAGYTDILTRARAQLLGCELVLCEPSVLWLTEPVDANARLRPYVSAVHDLADQFRAAAVVGLHGAFEAARTARPEVPWTTDGVHPTSLGHALICRHWLAATGVL